MKKIFGLLALFASVSIASATIIQFDLSPVGTDDAVGLSGLNENPSNASPASGGETGLGIFYNDVTLVLSLGVGYGSAFGFSDLVGSFTGTHIHGPGNATQNASVWFNFVSLGLHQPASAFSGSIVGSMGLTAAQGAELLAGLNYLNIHSSVFPGGEIRAQLIPVPEPGTYALAAGLGLLAFAGWRRRAARLA